MPSAPRLVAIPHLHEMRALSIAGPNTPTMPSHQSGIARVARLRPTQTAGAAPTTTRCGREGNHIHEHVYGLTLLLAQEERFYGGWLLQQPGGAIKRVVHWPVQAGGAPTPPPTGAPHSGNLGEGRGGGDRGGGG